MFIQVKFIFALVIVDIFDALSVSLPAEDIVSVKKKYKLC